MPTVLHIDSDPVSSTRVERALRAGGYSTMRAHSGLDGVELARRCTPDLVLVAAPLPDLDAHAVTLRLRALPGWADRAIVVVDDTADVQASVAVGASGHVRRDAPASILVRDVARYLRGDREHPDHSSEIRLRDFSQRMAADLESQLRALQAANRDLEHLVKIRTELLRNVSHEIATPITPAIGYVDLLRSGSIGPITDIQRQVLDSLAASLDRLQHVTGILRDVSAFENSEIKPRFTKFSLGRLARTLEETWNTGSVRLRVDAPKTTVDIQGDAALIARALGRVIENAFKFGGTGVLVVVRIEAIDRREPHDAPRHANADGDADAGAGAGHASPIESSAEGARAQEIVVTVTDSGPGIEQHKLGRLGDLFHQLDGSPTRKHGGIGLGLAYARRVMDAHEGTLTIHSPPRMPVSLQHPTGAEVTLRWPRTFGGGGGGGGRPSRPAST